MKTEPTFSGRYSAFSAQTDVDDMERANRRHQKSSCISGGNLRRNEPLWRETGDGHGTTLVVTEAGLLIIGIEPVVASAVIKAREAKPRPGPAQQLVTAKNPKPVAIRADPSCSVPAFDGLDLG